MRASVKTFTKLEAMHLEEHVTKFLKNTPKDKHSNTHTPPVVPALVSLLGGPDKSNNLTGKQAVKSGQTNLRKAPTVLSLTQSKPPPSVRRSSLRIVFLRLLRMCSHVRPEEKLCPHRKQLKCGRRGGLRSNLNSAIRLYVKGWPCRRWRRL